MATGRIGVTPTLRTRWSKQPTAGTTSLSGLDDNSVALVYDVGYEAVYRNGALLSRGNDYTATNGTTVTLIDATLAGDIIEILANQLVPLTDAISKGQFNAKGALLSATAASTPGVLAVGANDTVLTADSTTATGLKWATPAASYTSWTPTFTNITTGNGTKTGSYVKNGKFVSGYAKIVFGSTTVITGTPILTLPSTPENGNISFTSIIADTGTATFNGFGEMSGADFYCYVNNASGTYVNTSNISATVPMIWTTNDSLTISFNYKEN